MDPFGDKQQEMMEAFHYYHPMSTPSPPPPPPSSSWATAGETSSPIHDPKEGRKGERRSGSTGVKLSTDPQSVAARERRHRISDRFRVLKSLVPGGSKMDTVSMLEEAIHYVKFLQAQIWLQQAALTLPTDDSAPASFPPATVANPSASIYTSSCASTCSSSSANAVPPQQMLGYAVPPPPPTPLPPFPCGSFQGEEEMLLPHARFNY